MSSGPGFVSLERFIAARLDEDEAVARYAAPGPWERYDQDASVHCAYGSPFDGEQIATAYGIAAQDDAQQTADHIARHDPARVLRDVTAHRRILDRYLAALPHTVHQAGIAVGLKAVACIYADHPDFDPNWRL